MRLIYSDENNVFLLSKAQLITKNVNLYMQNTQIESR